MAFQNRAPFGTPTPTLARSQYSRLRQEADYVQDRITAYHAREEQLAREIRKAERNLDEARTRPDSKASPKSCNKSVGKWRSRQAQCARNRQALEARLADLSVEIQRLEQRQWG